MSKNDWYHKSIAILNEGVTEVEEGKTWKDDKDNGRQGKYNWKTTQQERKTNKERRLNGEDLEEGVDHNAEAERYDRLAKEARNQVTSAQSPEYYEKMSKKHREWAKNANVIAEDADLMDMPESQILLEDGNTLHIEINMENDAFQDHLQAREISNILKNLATSVSHGHIMDATFNINLRDSNGNTVGKAYVK